jgi:PAS domain S-box-containing protein
MMELKNEDLKVRKLKIEKQRLQNILQCSKTGTWEWNMLTGKTVFNSRWAEMIGYELCELSPSTVDTWRRFVHPEDLPNADSTLSRHISGQADHYECEIRMKHKDGHWVWVRSTGKIYRWTKDGEPQMMSGSHVEITEPKQSFQALKEREKKLLLAIFEHDLSTGAFFTTPELYRDLGYEGKQLPKTIETAVELIHPEDALLMKTAAERYLKGATDHFYCKYRLKGADGQWKWCSVTGEAIHWSEDGKPGTLLGLAQNINDLHQEQPEQGSAPSV